MIVKKTNYYWKRAFPIYLMILPGLLFFLIFRYGPMFGVIIAFKDYNVFKGFFGSEWVGFEHFIRFFSERNFTQLLRTTMLLNLMGILFFFPAPILIAVILNEVRKKWIRVPAQTILYSPHFISWVVVVGISKVLFSNQFGSINMILENWGLEKIELLTDPAYFRWVWLFQNIWKDTGWNAIIFLATLAAVDPQLYEAAYVDGAGRIRQIWHITLPALVTVTVILFILRLGQFMDVGFEHIYLLQNPLNLNVSDVFDTYVYRTGILKGQLSYTAAVGFFKSLVALVLVLGANTLAKKTGQEGVF
jgi:putative aldouronate transport system permease protein